MKKTPAILKVSLEPTTESKSLVLDANEHALNAIPENTIDVKAKAIIDQVEFLNNSSVSS